MIYNNPRIFILCPDSDRPIGGIKQIYRHVDILNKNGFNAFVLHQKPGFRCTWFDNSTKIAYKTKPKKFNIFKSNVNKDIIIETTDYLVIPENNGPKIAEMAKGTKKIIFNQNSYYTFNGYTFDKNDHITPYTNDEISAVIVVSEDNRKYLEHVFPKLRIYRITNGIDPAVFSFNPAKKQQIAFMPRKHPEDALQVINILKFRGALKDYEIIPIENQPEKEVAKVLKESLIFLSFGYPEGFALPPAEAMACGCIVIGYDGEGTKELFKSDFCYPIRNGDIPGFARTVETIIDRSKEQKDSLLETGKRASDFILKNYSLEAEEASIVSAWGKIIEQI